MNELKKQLENIREDLESIRNAEHLDEDGEIIGLYDYFDDVLDFEYVISSSREYLGAKIWITLGGPNIWIDTRAEQINGAWGNDRATVYIPKNLASEIDAIFEGLYNCY